MYSNPTQYPSVTEIISPYVNFSGIPPAILQAACERGTMVHDAVAGLLMDDFPSIPDTISGYIESFERWRDAMVADVLLVEERLSDERLGYTGQIDLVARIQGDDCWTVIDWKTAVTGYAAWAVQTAAYRELVITNHNILDLKQMPILRRMSIRLRKDGRKPAVTEYTRASDMAVFHGLLNAHHYFKPRTIEWEAI